MPLGSDMLSQTVLQREVLSRMIKEKPAGCARQARGPDVVWPDVSLAPAIGERRSASSGRIKGNQSKLRRS